MTGNSISGDGSIMSRTRVAILISGRGSNMAALIEAAKDKTYPAEIVLVLSNRPDAGGLTHARAAGIATEIVDHKAHGKDRAGFERAMQAVLDAHGIELICLAGFMRLLTDGFVEAWGGRMINVHPALLPAFKGLDTHERALAAGVKIHGATVHFVVPEMDSGPIIAQGAVAVHDDDDAASACRARAYRRAPHLPAGAQAGGRGPRAHGKRPLPHRRRGDARRCLLRPRGVNVQHANCNSQGRDGVTVGRPCISAIFLSAI